MTEVSWMIRMRTIWLYFLIAFYQLMYIFKIDKETNLSSHQTTTLRWRHNGCDNVSNHQPRECLLRRLIRRTSKKTSKLRVTGLCAGNSPETGEFPAQMASNAENVSIWWRHHDDGTFLNCITIIVIIWIVVTTDTIPTGWLSKQRHWNNMTAS